MPLPERKTSTTDNLKEGLIIDPITMDLMVDQINKNRDPSPGFDSAKI